MAEALGMIPEQIRVLKPGFDGGVTDTQKLFVVAFDEGVRTGWFVCRVRVDALVSRGLRGIMMGSADPDVFTWNSGYFEGPEPWQAELMMALVRGTWMHGEGEFELGVESDLFFVVGEQFKLRMIGDDATVLSPVRVQSMFRQLSWRAPFPFLLANISDAMSVFTDARLRAFNLWSGEAGAMGEHQRDATRYGAIMLRKMASEPGFVEAVCRRMPWLEEKLD